MSTIEKTTEIIVDEDGARLVVRPQFPFFAEGFRVREEILEVFGEGRVLPLPFPEDLLWDLRGFDELVLCEYGPSGQDPVREIVLSRDG